jgi:hypothetical protein
MTATSQHGFHPDAESLSAFSEQVLQERERTEVLMHLAVCGRCREVVALATKAADAGGMAAAAPTRKTAAPNAWWKQWRMIWIPTAVVSAFAAASILVYIERSDRHAANIRIAEQNPISVTTPPSKPAPTEQAKVEPPSAEVPATPPVHTAKKPRSTAPEPPPAAAPPVVDAQMPSESAVPEPEASEPRQMAQVEAYRETQRSSRAQAMQATPGLAAGGMPPPASPPDSGAIEAEKKRAEQQRQAEPDRSQMRSLKARVAPFAVSGADTAPPAGTTESAPAAPQSGVQPAAAPEAVPMLGIEHGRNFPAPVEPFQLPSGLAAVSNASGNHVLLAIDKAGALFLSEDRGVTWQRIDRQWTGRAVAVRRQPGDHDVVPAAPAVQNGTTDKPSGDASATSPPSASFELSNDKNQTWMSTDGRTWTPK